jgi:hypothetical protein
VIVASRISDAREAEPLALLHTHGEPATGAAIGCTDNDSYERHRHMHEARSDDGNLATVDLQAYRFITSLRPAI